MSLHMKPINLAFLFAGPLCNCAHRNDVSQHFFYSDCPEFVHVVTVYIHLNKTIFSSLNHAN